MVLFLQATLIGILRLYTHACEFYQYLMFHELYEFYGSFSFLRKWDLFWFLANIFVMQLILDAG